MDSDSSQMPMSPWLVHRGRYVDVTFMIAVGEAEYLVTIDAGRVVRIAPGPHVMPCWTFALRAERASWQRFWGEKAIPGYHDLFAMLKFRTLGIVGDQTIFMQNLMYFKEVVRQLGDQIDAR